MQYTVPKQREVLNVRTVPTEHVKNYTISTTRTESDVSTIPPDRIKKYNITRHQDTTPQFKSKDEVLVSTVPAELINEEDNPKQKVNLQIRKLELKPPKETDNPKKKYSSKTKKTKQKTEDNIQQPKINTVFKKMTGSQKERQPIDTQIHQPEPVTRVVYTIISCSNSMISSIESSPTGQSDLTAMKAKVKFSKQLSENSDNKSTNLQNI